MKIILASRSPRRTILLKQIGLRFRVHPSNVTERFDRRHSPSHNVRRIAVEKALDVASHYSRGVVIGADTVVVLGRTVLGKPESKSAARAMLQMLSGREHSVYTGFALVDASTKRYVSDVERTRVRFRKLTLQEINEYVSSGTPMDKAGAYGIQDDYGAVFVERIRGCYYNVVGFPLAKFYMTFKQFLRRFH